VRLALERLTVQLACVTPSPVGLKEMQEVADQMARLMTGEATARQASELDLSFHDVLYHMSGHQRLIAFWTQLKPQVQVFLLSRNVAAPDFREIAVNGHQQILDAHKACDEGCALDIIEKHLQVGYQRLLSSYE
jgi:DNA-binding GntR family transcriptional regulator